MNNVGVSLPVALFLRRVLNLVSSISVTTQYLRLRNGELEPAADINPSLISQNVSGCAPWHRSAFYQAMWASGCGESSSIVANDKLDLRGSVSEVALSPTPASETPKARWSDLRNWRWPSLPRVPASQAVHHRTLFSADVEATNCDTWSREYYEEEKITLPPPPCPPSPQPTQCHEPGVDPGLCSPIQQLLSLPTLFEPLRRPRYPIVLCHGLYGFDVRGPSSFPRLQKHYWSNVLEILKEKIGAEVIVTGVPGTGSIQARAARMNEFLQDKARGRAVNLMAHSMGGLDCRHLITHCKPEEYAPISLTTISTPHRGSPFMDWCTANIGIGKHNHSSSLSCSNSDDHDDTRTVDTPEPPPKPSAAQFTLSSLPSSFTTLLLSLIDSPAYSNLSTSYLEQVFNPATPDDPRVKYYSIAARTDALSVWHPLWLPKMVLDGVEEKERERLSLKPSFGEHDEWGNDGLVSVRSAKWGEFLGTLEGCDHWEIRGARGLGIDLNVDLANPLVNALPGVSWGWRDWGRFVGAWNKEETHREMMEGVHSQECQEEGGGGERDEVVESSTDKLSAVVDWIVDQVPSTSPRQPSVAEAERKATGRSDMTSKFDLERFYVALSRKLYDDGL